MISLAPLRYSQALRNSGGPIERLEYAEGEVLGESCYQAVTYLKSDLVDQDAKAETHTQQPDGAGSHSSFQIACHMAISEAIERWAVYHCRDQTDPNIGGMRFDSSSNGFAAFPGMFKRQARNAAYRESIERHCLICWWEGLLSHTSLPDPRDGVNAILLDNPLSSHSVVLIWSLGVDGSSYAFGAGKSPENAIWRACVELDRTQAIIKKFPRSWLRKGSQGQGDTLERRISYFSRPQGTAAFIDRIEHRYATKKIPKTLLFDEAVSGPWKKYADVWRTIIEPPSKEYLGSREDYFFW